MQQPDVHRLIELQRLLLIFNQVERKAHRKHHDDYVAENDVEHSYNLAMTVWYLSQWFPALDRDQMMKIAMAHDLVETYAGDTFIYASAEELATKKEREHAAYERLLSEWSDFDELFSAIRSYESRDTPEAKFVYALDKIMPVLTVYISDGHSWKKNGLTVEMLRAVKNDKVALSPEILPYYESLMDILVDHPELIPPR
jgi:putative hydrolase of HD superfamily